MAKEKDDKKAEKKLENAAPVATVEVEATPAAKVDTEQENKELVFRLLWQASRILKGATAKEIIFYWPTIQKWVGEKRADALVKKWRTGKE